MDSLNRRQFVARGSGLLASLTALAAGWPALLEKAAAATRGLTEARRRTYLAVVAAVGRGTASPTSDEAIARLEAWYDAASDDERLALEAALDAIESEGSDHPFSTLREKDAQARVTRWSTARTKAEREFDAQAHRAARWSKHGDPAASLKANEERIAEIVRAVRAQYGEEALGLDPETGLPRWSPAPYDPPHKPHAPKRDTEESRLRGLAAAAFSLATLAYDTDRDPAIR